MREKWFVFVFFSEFFSNFEQKFFQTFGEKSSKSCQNYLLRVQRISLWLEIFFESFESFWYFLQKPLAWFSNFYLRVQSKNCGRNSFLIFLFRIFSDFEQKIFQTFGQKTSKSCQNYLLRVQRNSLWLEIFFLKFWIVLNFLHKPSACFSKFYLRVQSKNCGRNSFLIFLSGVYLDFERKFFQTFGEKTSKVVKTTFCMSRGTICGLNFF